MITAYSFAMSVIFFNISLVIVYLLRRKESFIARYGIQTLMVITVLGFLRLVLPVDFERSIVVRSYDVNIASSYIGMCGGGDSGCTIYSGNKFYGLYSADNRTDTSEATHFYYTPSYGISGFDL